jgi:hypothetical protein
MTRDDLEAQRAEVAQAAHDHEIKAAEARGAIRLIDLWLARLAKEATDAATVPQPGA